MKSSGIPRQVQQFIHACIHSVEQLEILLLIHKKPSDAESINRQLRTSITSVETRLGDLLRKDLIHVIEEDGRRIYALNPSEKLAKLLAEVSGLYQSHRVAMIDLIFSQAPDALKSFSDAFRFRE